MPQLIAMVIVVVGAMIYMFQTFGGTGDKIEGIAQKTSIMTEINNIKNGLQLAVRSGELKASDGDTSGAVKTLEGLAELEYFADQINNELQSDNDATLDTKNTYQAISFGSGSNLEITLVTPAKTAITNARPGLFIDLTKGNLKSNAGFLEKQLATDLKALASIDSKTKLSTKVAVLNEDGTIKTAGATDGTDTDGTFTLYFKDIPANIQK